MAKLKKINGHVRFIFAYRDVKTSMFIMLDDGRVFMEIFNSKRTDDYSAIERIHSFNKKMSKYLIDERTDIVYTSDYAHYEDPKHNNTDILYSVDFLPSSTSVCAPLTVAAELRWTTNLIMQPNLIISLLKKAVEIPLGFISGLS